MPSPRRLPLVVLALAAFALPGCATKAQTGTLIGAGAGGAAGAVIGHQHGSRTKGAAIGAAVGALGGYLIGSSQDDADAERPKGPTQADPTPMRTGD